MPDPAIPVVFAAGLVSFASPCVLPLVPGYLSYMSGMGGSEEGERLHRTAPVALAFVAGFTAVFVALGASATALGNLLSQYKLEFERIGGVAIIVMGLAFMGLLRARWLYREARFHPTPRAGIWGSILLGAAFAFGWSPCIGATLSVALTMATGGASSGGPAEGAFLLAVYSLGLGVPFVLAGLGISRMTATMTWLRRRARAVNLTSGALLVAVGFLLLTGQLFHISAWMQRGLTSAGLDFWSF